MPGVKRAGAYTIQGGFEGIRKKYSPNSEDRAHLHRWADDDRAEELWEKIEGAAQSNKLTLPAEHFIAEILAARRVAMAIGHRGKWREDFRNAADEMERSAKFLRKPHPYGTNSGEVSAGASGRCSAPPGAASSVLPSSGAPGSSEAAPGDAVGLSRVMLLYSISGQVSRCHEGA